MMFHGYELTTEWKNSQCGKTAKAVKGGKSYFLKRYQALVAPIDNGTLDAKTFAHNKKQFDDFVDTRKRVNSTIRKISGAGGNIVIPCDEFIEGNQYVEAAELIDGVVEEEELEGVLSSLSVDVKKLLMQTAAGALYSVHRQGIVHSDLKLQNVLLVRKKNGNFVAKLIDFDSSYFEDEKPEEVIGTIDYYSPELGAYSDSEDDREEMGKKLTVKSDIFSLGLIFHIYLSGSMPKPVSLTERLRKRQEKGKEIYCWIALNSGCELELSPAIKSPKYISLIRDMLSIDPDERPTANEVLKRLQEPEPVIEEPWPDHCIILDRDKMRTDRIVGLKKISGSGDKKYEILLEDGKKYTVDKKDLIEKKFAKAIAPAGFCESWSEHNITFDLDRIKSRGFVSAEQTTMSGIKGYNFFRADGNATFFKLEMLLAMKYAQKRSGSAPVAAHPSVEAATPVGSLDCSPWPEDNIEFDADRIKARGYVGVKKDTMGGVKGYKFVKTDGTEQFLRVEMVIVQKMARKL